MLNALWAASDSALPQAQKMLEGDNPRPMDMEREQAAEIVLRDIRKMLENVMYAFDSVMRSISMPPRYKIFFRARDVTDDGWEKLIAVLDEDERLARREEGDS